jgi:hypothetical protein
LTEEWTGCEYAVQIQLHRIRSISTRTECHDQLLKESSLPLHYSSYLVTVRWRSSLPKHSLLMFIIFLTQV